jgi:exodeoxyribonuclease VII large subunit
MKQCIIAHSQRARTHLLNPSDKGKATVYRVSELTEILRELVEGTLPRVWVTGEISNFVRPASGHWYFTLKDSGSQLRCVMFKGQNFLIRPQPKDGDAVQVRATASVYAARGDLQLICEHLESAGEGALLRAFEQLKAKLAAEGLFDAKLKRPIPAVPRAIGLITSSTGAAIHDVVTTLSRRFPLLRVFHYPVPVQGVEAPVAIVRALGELPKLAAVDAILLTRGGGSLEDLWAFNDERVARAIRACEVPVVCGVGHEIDFTIADFAADLRAPTPTAAAELISPDVAEWRRTLDRAGIAVAEALQRRLANLRGGLGRHGERLALLHPGRRLRDAAQRLDEWWLRLTQAQRSGAARATERSGSLAGRLLAASPSASIAAQRRHLDALQRSLQLCAWQHSQRAQLRLTRAYGLLGSLDPHAVLARGYAIALDADGHAIKRAGEVSDGAAVDVLLAQGRLHAIVQRRSE